MDIQIIAEPVTEQRKRICCNCGNNIRIKDDNGIMIDNHCDIDGHRISYTECFEHWCPHWRKDRKWEEN